MRATDIGLRDRLAEIRCGSAMSSYARLASASSTKMCRGTARMPSSTTSSRMPCSRSRSTMRVARARGRHADAAVLARSLRPSSHARATVCTCRDSAVRSICSGVIDTMPFATAWKSVPSPHPAPRPPRPPSRRLVRAGRARLHDRFGFVALAEPRHRGAREVAARHVGHVDVEQHRLVQRDAGRSARRSRTRRAPRSRNARRLPRRARWRSTGCPAGSLRSPRRPCPNKWCRRPCSRRVDAGDDDVGQFSRRPVTARCTQSVGVPLTKCSRWARAAPSGRRASANSTRRCDRARARPRSLRRPARGFASVRSPRAIAVVVGQENPHRPSMAFLPSTRLARLRRLWGDLVKGLARLNHA